MFYNVYIIENENSTPYMRENLPHVHAHAIGKNAGYYKVQLLCVDTGIVEYEYK